MNDSEHILCKIWLCVMHSHSSRNYAEEKQVSNGHCHPLPGGKRAGDELLRPIMLAIWESFVVASTEIHDIYKEEDVPKRQYEHPAILLFREERKNGLGPRIASLLRDKAIARLKGSAVPVPA